MRVNFFFFLFADNIDYLYDINVKKDGTVADGECPDDLLAAKRVFQEHIEIRKEQKDQNLKDAEKEISKLPAIVSLTVPGKFLKTQDKFL